MQGFASPGAAQFANWTAYAVFSLLTTWSLAMVTMSEPGYVPHNHAYDYEKLHPNVQAIMHFLRKQLHTTMR